MCHSNRLPKQAPQTGTANSQNGTCQNGTCQKTGTSNRHPKQDYPIKPGTITRGFPPGRVQKVTLSGTWKSIGILWNSTEFLDHKGYQRDFLPHFEKSTIFMHFVEILSFPRAVCKTGHFGWSPASDPGRTPGTTQSDLFCTRPVEMIEFQQNA